MRKKTFAYILDNSFWYFIYLLPLFVMLFITFQSGVAPNMSQTFTTLGLSIFNDNVILTSLNSIFGASGIFPLFATTDILIYMTYFVSVEIIHLAVDFLLFIPRLCQKFAKKFYQDDIH